MFLNLIVALSNIPAINPIYRSMLNNDYVTSLIIGYVASMSFVSHLFENHKHDMPGIGFSKQISYLLNRMDVLGCGLTIARFIYLYYQKFGMSMTKYIHKYILMLLLCFSLLIISEHDNLNKTLRTRYIITHCLWHIGIFFTMDTILKNVIY